MVKKITNNRLAKKGIQDMEKKIKAMKILVHTIIVESIQQGYTEIDISKPDDGGMIIRLIKEQKKELASTKK